MAAIKKDIHKEDGKKKFHCYCQVENTNPEQILKGLRHIFHEFIHAVVSGRRSRRILAHAGDDQEKHSDAPDKQRFSMSPKLPPVYIHIAASSDRMHVFFTETYITCQYTKSDNDDARNQIRRLVVSVFDNILRLKVLKRSNKAKLIAFGCYGKSGQRI